MIPSQVTLVEVGPRDGLQNEAQPVSAADKIELVRRLQAAGLREIEVTSFVSPKWVPQMADNAEVMAGVRRLNPPGRPQGSSPGAHQSAPVGGVRYSVLTPNLKGFEAAIADPARRPDEIVVFGAASEAFSQRNINCSIEESIERFRPVVVAAHAQGIKVRSAISCALGCPYQGEVTPDEVERVVVLMKGIGVDHCGVADTIGVGTPKRAQAALERALRHYPLDQVSGHFHDTYGQALANIYACLELGIHTFDASVAGLGGCPYAKGATGNVGTEDVLFMLNGLGIETGIDIERLVDAAAFISQRLGRKPVSRTGNALLAKRAAAQARATAA
ncbi:MAG: hydroxymethylglutaryl-CoA lyase [Burkholderiaceae bacterium]